MNFRWVVCIFSISVLLGGCSGAQFINVVTPESGYTVARDIPFGEHHLTLDVYAPKDVANAPLVVFFYGGSWQAGKTLGKSSYKFVGQALAHEGYVAVVADYRLYPDVKYPAFLQDGAEAIRWAHAHAADYGADQSKLIVMGHSAGAYNAAMLTLNPLYLKQAGVDHAWIRGMIGLAGPYDFLPIVDPALQSLFGDRQQWTQTQPIEYVDGHEPPMLLMAGDADDIVYVKNTNNLYREILAHGGKATKVIYPGMGHIQIVAQMSTWIPGHDAMMLAIRQFVVGVTH